LCEDVRELGRNIGLSKKKTIVGQIADDALAFTAGADIGLDLRLAEADCLGTAAHVTMLSRMKSNALISASERAAVVKGLVVIMRQAREGRFKIRPADQDIHLAIERTLTQTVGDVGKRIHTGRSRNDQVAVALRLYGKQELFGLTDEIATLAKTLVAFGYQHRKLPMVGRTHMQPAMPSSVGLWSTAFAESLLDDLIMVDAAQQFNDVCPLGAAAGYGVPLPLDRELSASLLGFSRAHGNTIYAVDSRGKCEGVILSACAQVMLTLSRLAQDMMLYTLPEFGYFSIPAEYATGSSIMPQKRNPDVFELVRARSHVVLGQAQTVQAIMHGLPSGYNRDAQETKAPFMAGIDTTRQSLRIVNAIMSRLTVNEKPLRAAFDGSVFATDAALKLVADGMPFRDAYQHIKANVDQLERENPDAAIAAKTHLGTTAGLDFGVFRTRIKAAKSAASKQERGHNRAMQSLMGVPYPELG
jgi:argininosuccinate lyase